MNSWLSVEIKPCELQDFYAPQPTLIPFGARRAAANLSAANIFIKCGGD
jgi:hypothetical protein